MISDKDAFTWTKRVEIQPVFANQIIEFLQCRFVVTASNIDRCEALFPRVDQNCFHNKAGASQQPGGAREAPCVTDSELETSFLLF
jgi:hypothetical protein